MVAAGFEVVLLEDCRSTPELSFTVRYKQCACGIMITASHNPPSDNGFKAYWSTGGQVVPPHDKGIIEEVYSVETVERADFDEAVAAGKILPSQQEIDPAFAAAVSSCALPGPRDLKILYSPLHGVGATAVCPVLAACGFHDVEVYGPHATQDGDFPNVPDHVSNPENSIVFAAIVERAKEIGADLVMASDPDCDRIGLAAPRTTSHDSPWATLSGNQIVAILAEYVLERRQAAGSLSSDHYLIKTLVTTDMVRRIGDAYGVTTYGNLLVGFKWIGEVMDQVGPDRFVFGGEESHGYLIGQYARDKDGAAAAMLVAGLAAQVKAEGKTLHEKLDALYWQYGYHAEKLFSLVLPGAQGMEQMKKLMQLLRSEPPESLAGVPVAAVRDYLAKTITKRGESPEPLEGPTGDLIILDLAVEGTYVAVRPSGTEPKVKFYMFTYEPAEQIHDLDAIRAEHDQRLEGFADGLRAIAAKI
ncbi:MAG: phospho-sugar mutase, partial [Planctomycetales bacterium]|nr:phospho-sugar mutase [Planctomycetales bacterium]